MPRTICDHSHRNMQGRTHSLLGMRVQLCAWGRRLRPETRVFIRISAVKASMGGEKFHGGGPISGEICSHCLFVMWNYTSRGNLITVLVLESSHPDSRLHKYGRILYLSTMYL